ncbi:MAG: TIM barrel protein, partial [Chloroflexota bacterium]
MFSRPKLGVNTAVYSNTPLADSIEQIAQLDVDGVVIKQLGELPDNKNLNLYGLQIFGIEAADYGFGQMPENFELTLDWCQGQRCQFVVIPNPLQFEPTTAAQAQQFVTDVQQMADTAVSKKINIVVKVAHRFETTLLNTLSDAEAFIEQVGRPNVKVELGTFDLQIEEQDGAGQMGRLGERIAFLRMSDSNQGAIGEGNMKLG